LPNWPHTSRCRSIDDAQWADSATLSLLRHVAADRAELRLLIVLTYREIEPGTTRPLNAVLLDLNRERLATRIKLARLDREQTRGMLAAMFQTDIAREFLDGFTARRKGIRSSSKKCARSWWRPERYAAPTGTGN
jgi:predicted ATPase